MLFRVARMRGLRVPPAICDIFSKNKFKNEKRWLLFKLNAKRKRREKTPSSFTRFNTHQMDLVTRRLPAAERSEHPFVPRWSMNLIGHSTIEYSVWAIVRHPVIFPSILIRSIRMKPYPGDILRRQVQFTKSGQKYRQVSLIQNEDL